MSTPQRRAVQSYRDLMVWQKGMNLLVASYRKVTALPDDERYGLVTQIRRAAVSILANIAEGAGRDHLGDYLRHLSIASGSLSELETCFEACGRLGYLPRTELNSVLMLTDEIGRMLSGLKRRLAQRRRHPSRQI
jgi:four helix bundle protein